MSEEMTLDEFGSISDENVSGWSEEKLQSLIEQDEAGVWGDEPSGDGVRVLRATNYSPNTINLDDVAIRDIPESKKETKRLKSGDIIIERSGGSADQPVGRVLFFDLEGEYYHGNFLRQIRPDVSKINSRYLYYQLDYDYRRGHTKPLQTNTTNIRNLQYESYLNQNISVPPKTQQRKVATVLQTVDQAIEKTEQIINKYQAIVSGIIQDIATTGVNNDNLHKEKVPMLPEKWEIPNHWELEFLENITTLITDGAHQTPTYVENGVPFLKVEDIKQESINWESAEKIPEEEHNDLIKSGNPTKGDVLLSKNGTIGITKVVDWERDFSHFVSLALIRPNQNIILPEYLSTLLESQICMRQAKARSKTGTVTNLHLEEIQKLSIPVPPISEQRDILDIIYSVKQGLNAEVQYRNQLQRMKQGLMQDLLSGKVRTTDNNIEVPDEIAQYG